jgi:Spy/CpxP family protein refolding chaperone
MTFPKQWRRPAQALVLAVAAVGLVAVSAAARQPAQAGQPRGMRAPMLFAQLDLTTEQQAQIKTIFTEQRSAGESNREALRAAHDELRAAMFGSATPDTGSIDALVSRIAELEADMLRARVATELKVSAILTDEQRQQLATAKPPRRGHRGPLAPRGR